MTNRQLVFLTNPEPNVFILNVNDKDGLRRITLTLDQIKVLARDAVNYITGSDKCRG